MSEALISRDTQCLPLPPRRKATEILSRLAHNFCQFLESARADDDPLYVAYVLMLILGLRRGEALGLPRCLVNLDRAELDVR
jgi:hypothetical protein